MQKSKGYALMFVLGAFLAGGALGFTADRLVTPSKPCTGGERGYWKRMHDELGLTAAQSRSIDSLMDQRRVQMRALFKPIKPQLDSLSLEGRKIGDSTHAQVRRLLDPAQQVKWDEMRKRSRKKDSLRGPWGGASPAARR